MQIYEKISEFFIRKFLVFGGEISIYVFEQACLRKEFQSAAVNEPSVFGVESVIIGYTKSLKIVQGGNTLDSMNVFTMQKYILLDEVSIYGMPNRTFQTNGRQQWQRIKNDEQAT